MLYNTTMLETLSEVVQERAAETLFPSPVGVIKRVAEIMNGNENFIVFSDYSDYPLPRFNYSTEISYGQRAVRITVEFLLKDEEIEISVYDPTLSPGEPRDHSFSYRVNIFSGKSAEKIRGSIGYMVEALGRNKNLDNGARVVTDNWAETNLSAKEVLEMLGTTSQIRLPKYDEQERTDTGTPRHFLLKQIP